MSDLHFRQALYRRDLKTVKNLMLKEGCSVNMMFPDGMFPLHVAAERGDTATVKFLLSVKAKTTYVDHHYRTALMLGIMFPDIVQILLDSNCNLNSIDFQCRTALHLACAQGMAVVVSRLVIKGADINAQDRWNRTPLHVALYNMPNNNSIDCKKYLKIIRILIHNGCEVNVFDNSNASPLSQAVMSNDSQAVEFLVSAGSNINAVSRHNMTPVQIAVVKGYVDICKQLVKYGADVNSKHKKMKYSTLQLVFLNKESIDIIFILVKAGYKYYNDGWLYSGDVSKITKSFKIRTILEQLRSSPPKLLQLCRNCIRQSLVACPLNDLSLVNYPVALKNYINLNDLHSSTF